MFTVKQRAANVAFTLFVAAPLVVVCLVLGVILKLSRRAYWSLRDHDSLAVIGEDMIDSRFEGFLADTWDWIKNEGVTR